MSVDVDIAAATLPPLWRAIEALHERRDPDAFERTWQQLTELPGRSYAMRVRKDHDGPTVCLQYRATTMPNLAGEPEHVIELRWMP